MNLDIDKYKSFALVHEMMDTVEIVKQFNKNITKEIVKDITSIKNILLTGEGSSRIFPAKNAVRKAKIRGINYNFFTECSHQANQYKLF